MSTKRREVVLAAANAAAFVAMVVVNGLANGLPLNGRRTGEISALYPNLFVPAGLTFAIWGLIYLLLAAFCVHGLVVALRPRQDAAWLRRLGPLFVVSSLANAGWIFAWHWLAIGLSLVLMLVLLASLVLAYLRLGIGKEPAGLVDRLLVHLPFRIYLGWITVATIANVTAWLVALGWDGLGLPPSAWAVGVIVAAVAITLAVVVTRDDLPYALVVVWALVGIHLARSGDSAEPAPAVSTAALAGAGLLLVAALAHRVLRGRRGGGVGAGGGPRRRGANRATSSPRR